MKYTSVCIAMAAALLVGSLALHKPSNAREASIAPAVSARVVRSLPARVASWEQPIKSAQGRASLDHAATPRQRRSHQAARS